MRNGRFLKTFASGLVGVVVGCGSLSDERDYESQLTNFNEEDISTNGTDVNTNGGVGMSNPAAVYCHDIGGEGRIETSADGGQHTICVLSDGTEIRAWDLFCQDIPDSPYCGNR